MTRRTPDSPEQPTDPAPPANRSRRAFIQRSALLGGYAVTAGGLGLSTGSVAATNLPPNVPSWMRTTGPGVTANPYGMPSRFEAHVVRRQVEWLTASPISSVSFTPLADLQGIITPNGLHFERHHAGVPEIDPEQHRLMIHGMVERPLILTVDELMRFPSTSVIHFLECPANGGMEWRGAQMEALQFTHGMVSCCEWTGVRLATLLAEVGLQPEAKWLLAEGADGAAMARSIPIEKALDDALVVYAQNGEMLRPEQGYPVRLLLPGWEGNTNVKWLRRLELGDQPWYLREETSKYTDLMPDGRAREFTWAMDVKSVITSPCPEKPLRNQGLCEIQGLAWSGRGRIKRVDISFDGGVNWQPTELKGLVLPKALTRFSLLWHWQGQPALLQSRAIDETGDVQPTLGQLREMRGVNSIYHNNAIHTWKLAAGGEVTNVQID
jgi:sulfane dehydrogenase subunit SoxC